MTPSLRRSCRTAAQDLGVPPKAVTQSPSAGDEPGHAAQHQAFTGLRRHAENSPGRQAFLLHGDSMEGEQSSS